MTKTDKKGDQTTKWTFTWNNYTEDDIKFLKSLTFRYMVFGKELAPTTGTPHLQGYVVWRTNYRFAGMKKIFKNKHFEKAEGNHYQCSMYCKKGIQTSEEWKELGVNGPNYGIGADYVELGSLPATAEEKGQMEKDRWEEARNAAKAGDFDAIPADIYMRCRSTCHAIATDHMKPPEPLQELDNYWFWGPTGTGKSHRARNEFPEHYLKRPNKWWDGYCGQETVIIEEWNPDMKMLASMLKEWADKWPFTAEVKGGTRILRPRRIIVTSNYCPQECFVQSADLDPILRRFNVVEFK